MVDQLHLTDGWEKVSCVVSKEELDLRLREFMSRNGLVPQSIKNSFPQKADSFCGYFNLSIAMKGQQNLGLKFKTSSQKIIKGLNDLIISTKT